MPSTVLETPRLTLRPPAAEDLPGFVEFHSDAVTMEYLGGVTAEADTWRALAMMIGTWSLNPASMFSVIVRETGDWVGRIGPWIPHQWPVQEVGWGVLRRAEGNGYALEAAVASLDYVFDELDWERVDHLIDEGNTRSQALAERLGSAPGDMVKMPGELSKYDVRAWGQTREHWLDNRHRFDELVPR